jgi:phytoene dehydrogenase-like protein
LDLEDLLIQGFHPLQQDQEHLLPLLTPEFRLQRSAEFAGVYRHYHSCLMRTILIGNVIQIIKPENGLGVEVVLPSLIDPSAAPPGYATVEMTTLIPHAEARSWFPTPVGGDLNAWERSDAYRARRAELGDRLIALAETAIPDLRRHIVLRSDATPVTMARFDWSTDGAIYGVRTAERFRGSKSPLPGLVLAGSANFGGGTEAVVMSGAMAADALVPGLLRRGTPAIETRAA